MRRFVTFAKATILGGIIFLVPLVVIALVLAKAFQIALKIAHPIAALFPVQSLPGHIVAHLIAVLIIILICFGAGFLARSTTAKTLVQKAEDRFLWRTPGYGLVKGMADSFITDPDSETMHPVLLHLDDASQLAFEVERLADGRVVVFLPDSPEPWSGSVLIVTAERVEKLPVSMLAAAQNIRQLGRETSTLLTPRSPEMGNRTQPTQGKP